MALSLGYVLWHIFALALTGWILFNFAARILSRLLGKVLKAEVRFRFAGVRRLKHISIHFTKGPLASLTIGEIYLRLPLAILNFKALQDFKFHLCISEVDVSIRKSRGSRPRTTSRERARPKVAGQLKTWPIIANCARHVNITVTDLKVRVLEVPELSLDIKELDLDSFRSEDTTAGSLGIRLGIVPIAVHAEDASPEDANAVQFKPAETPERRPAVFSLEELFVRSNLKYVKGAGLLIEHVQVKCGAAEMNLKEDLLPGDVGLVQGLLRKEVREESDPVFTNLETQPVLSKQSSAEKSVRAIGKVSSLLPAQFSFSLPSLIFKCDGRFKASTMKCKFAEISVQSCVTHSNEKNGENAEVCDTELRCGEISILEEGEECLFQIQGVSTVASMELHTKANSRQRVEIDAKLEGVRCNIIPSVVDDFLKFYLRLPTNARKSESSSTQSSKPKKKSKSRLCWVCTVSAPAMGLTAYDCTGLTLFEVGSQSLQLFVDNVSGPTCRMQLEVGELEAMMVDEIRDDCTLARETKTNCFFYLGDLVMEWGTNELRFEEDTALKSCSVVIIECSQVRFFLMAIRLRALSNVAMSVKRYMKQFTAQEKVSTRLTAPGKSRKKSGWTKMEFKMRGLSIQYSALAVVDEVEVLDPKTVNFGDQGGKVIFSHNHDEVLRTASIKPTDFRYSKLSDGICTATFEKVYSLCSVDDHKRNLQFFFGCGQVLHEQVGIYVNTSKLTMLALENFKALYEGGNPENSIPSRLLVTAASVDGHWDPDLHLFYYSAALQVAALQGASTRMPDVTVGQKKAGTGKQKLRLAVDLERINFRAQLTQEIDFALIVQSLVSEDVEIGLLMEKILFAFNDSKVAQLEQIQVCRLPSSKVDGVAGSNGADGKVFWDVSIHAKKIRTILPFRLQLRAIDDAAEDMWRVLKLVMQSQRPGKATAPADQFRKKRPAAGFGSVLASVGQLTFEIEEEPLQGWLDEHHHLMSNAICKLRVQERNLERKREDAVQQAQSQVTLTTPGSRTLQALDSEWIQIHQEAFRAYRASCIKLVADEGSGACRSGLQSGFQMSSKRRSVLFVQASDVKMNLSPVVGSMVEAIRRLDCVGPETKVPYGKVYGRNLSIQASALVAHLRDFSFPLLETGALGCEGNVIVAQQATSFPPQVRQEIPLGRLRAVDVWRSISGSTPAYKTFFDLDINLDSGHISYGVGYEPVIADVSYALSVALQKAKPAIPVVKKERSLPWWDDMRYYIHGRNSLKINDFKWSVLATTDPYEDQEVLQMLAARMDVDQSEGSVVCRADALEWVVCRGLSSLQSHGLVDSQEKISVLYTPEFKLGISMDWKCESGNPFNHYLHPFPNALNPPEKKYDLFRSISLSLTFSFSLFCSSSKGWSLSSPLYKYGQTAAKGGFVPVGSYENRFTDESPVPVPMIYFSSQELKWILRLWNLFYSPPHKLRSFSKWPRFGIKKSPRSGNLSLDKTMTEFLLRLDATPGCIKHRSTLEEDPACGLTFRMKRLRYELLYSRCQSQFESTGPREPFLSVYQGLDFSMLNAGLEKSLSQTAKQYSLAEEVDKEDKVKELLGVQEALGESCADGIAGSKVNGGGFLLSMDCFTLRKQAPKAGLSQVSALLQYKRLSQGGQSATVTVDGVGVDSGSDGNRSDASDDEGFNVVLADNCLRVSVYELKILWTLPNRDAVWSWVEDFSRAFESPRPSPSRQSAQRKALELKQEWSNDNSDNIGQGALKHPLEDTEEEGVMHFMVNVVHSQFNLHSEEANGRFLLAAASGRVLARSFHSVLALGPDIIVHALRKEGLPCNSPQGGGAPIITSRRRELSVILEHVQAHVAPTDVDIDAGLQWLPKIPTGAPKVRRTGVLLERVFMPCSMYFQYTRHKGGTTDCKVKPLKELSFNSPNITATMTSNQFHIMVDVISNLLLARLPKPRKRPLSQDVGDEAGTDEGEEEVDEVVPEGVEEVEFARIKLEEAERECHAVIRHWAVIKRLDLRPQSIEIQLLEREFSTKRSRRRSAVVTLRGALQRAAQQRLMDKGKHKAPLAAMRISWAIDKFSWSMLCDGESFAEAEISSMILNVDRDFKDIGAARFTTKSFAVKNCLPGAKSSTVLSPWNPPAEWGRNVMLRVDAKQGAPKDGHSPLELFQVEIYPLKIYLTESMYRMMWDYLFPGDDHDFEKRQTVRSQHQKVTMAVGSTGMANQGRNPSISKTAEERELEISVEQVNSKVNLPPTGTALRTSQSTNSHVISQEDLLSTASIVSTTSVDSAKSKEQKGKKATKVVIQEEKKVTEERMVTRIQKRFLEFHHIKISQVELLVTYEGSRFSVNDLRLLMDTFTRLEFTGSWRRLFSKVKKHIIWSVLKSVTGMQGKKFKDKLPAQSQVDGGEAVDDYNSSDSSTSQADHEDRFPISSFKKHSDRAGEGFVSSIRGLFNSQRRKAKLLVRKLSIEHRNGVDIVGYVSGGDADSATSPQESLNLSKAKRLLKRHSRKRTPSGSQKGIGVMMHSQSSSSSPAQAEADLSDGSSVYEEFHEIG